MPKLSHSRTEPQGQLEIRTIAMPADTNANGDIFGGWVVSQMDLAGASYALKYTKGRAVTVAIESMTFITPVHIGDLLSCYVTLHKIGNTSIQIKIESWVISPIDLTQRQVTEGIFTFVAVDHQGRPRPIPKNS
ncbi:MAG: acyl-CoA thioesterase [Proteobacteria bacterium]|nr:acyl-CoA thioesterase [Pseudomonadota bacterium]